MRVLLRPPLLCFPCTADPRAKKYAKGVVNWTVPMQKRTLFLIGCRYWNTCCFQSKPIVSFDPTCDPGQTCLQSANKERTYERRSFYSGTDDRVQTARE